MNAGQDGFRDVSSKHISALVGGHGLTRSISRRGSIDHTICSYLASSGISNSTRIPVLNSSILADLHATSAMTADADFALYVSLDTMIFQAIRAILLASAMAASFDGLRLSSSVSQAEALPVRRAC